MGLEQVATSLRCPVCESAVTVSGSSLRCVNRHSFDISREGYVNLLTGRAKSSTADTAEMVASRRDFLGRGHFASLIDRVTASAVGAVDEDVPGLVLDAGGGTGEYLGAVLGELSDRQGVCLDVSKYAARTAAKALPEAGVVVADVWRKLPLRDRSCALVLDVFSPRNAQEFHRVLNRDGALIVVTPTALHLNSLVSALGLLTVDPDKPARLAEKLAGLFELESESLVTAELELSREDALAAALMGPSAAHVSAEVLRARTQALEEPFLTVLSAVVAVYRPLRRVSVA